MIFIHYDFTNGTELPYKQALVKDDNFTTNCLDFFTTDHPAEDVVIIDSNYKFISREELLRNFEPYCAKEIRPAHNILKMFKAGTFQFQKLDENEIIEDTYNLRYRIQSYINELKLLKDG